MVAPLSPDASQFGVLQHDAGALLVIGAPGTGKSAILRERFADPGGQTIGKMLTGIRVIGDDDRRVDTAGAVLRAFGCLITLATLGLGYLPVFLSADGRALHDRIAGTRVVKGDES